MKMERKYLAITDADGIVRTFEETDLLRQLVSANFQGTGPIKYAFRNLAKAVKEMRYEQKRFFSTPYGAEKDIILARAKALESKVDSIIARAQQIDLL
jgi:hypothetical protein